MKNKILLLLFIFFVSFSAYAESLSIKSKNISIDKDKEVSIFQGDVEVLTENQDKIKSDYAEYNKKKGLLILKNNIIATDIENNIIETNYAEYNEQNEILKSRGSTKITTIDQYIINGSNISVFGKEKIITSNDQAIIIDSEENKIVLENFEYRGLENIFKSIGNINIQDKHDNIYELTQIYIDAKKKEIIGTDSKLYLNENNLKIDKRNKPRIFSNTIKLNEKQTSFEKSIFTTCNYRENDKCPPWSIQSKKMLHDNVKKTIYYDHALIKLYDIPIFYIPKLAHPDPTIKRRSGFLPPTITNSKNLSSGISIPYFWAINDDKNFTLTNKLYSSENPLFNVEYHQVFNNSDFIADLGYTKGYKENSAKKKQGDKSHFFSRIRNKFNTEKSENTLKLSVQHVSDDKYLKLYKIDTNLVNYQTDILNNELDFTHENEELFLGFNASVAESLKSNYNDKYEYILPEITLDKNLYNSQKFGNLSLTSNYKSHRYNTNTLENFFVNDFNWNSSSLYSLSGIKNKFLANVRNINYNVKNFRNALIGNPDIYKKDTTNELYGAIGLMSEINLEKRHKNSNQFLKPKMLLRYAPGGMRQELSGGRLTSDNAFSINRLNNNKNFETGLTGTLGFDYKFRKSDKEFDFSVAQIINEKENKKMHDETSLNEKLSDLVGSASYDVNNNLKLKYNFNIDQNYNSFNYNEIETNFNYNKLNIDFGYLEENKHLGDKKYFKTKVDFSKSENAVLSFSNKRNLVTDSTDFYNLSYEYFNDCLRAGLVYRREFYNDSEIEPENSLMFKITLTPFGNVDTPSFIK